MTEQWVRPLRPLELLMGTFLKGECVVVCYALTVNSHAPLREETVREAVSHLYRKVPTLRLFIKRKEDRFWFHEMVEEKVYFQYLEGDPDEIYYQMLALSYSSPEGPLWRVCMIPEPAENQCLMPEVKLQFPYQYQIIFGFNHAITDGHSNMTICSAFMNILNDVIAKKPIDDNEQIGYLITGTELDHIYIDTKDRMLKEMENKDITLREIVRGNAPDTVINKAFPQTEGTPSKTLVLFNNFDINGTRSFLRLCKQNGISVHSAFSLILDAAIDRVVSESGWTDGNTQITSGHSVNMRRFCGPLSVRGLGLLAAYLFTSSKREKKFNNRTFWEHAKEFHVNFYEALKNRNAFNANSTLYLYDFEAMAELLEKQFGPALSANYISTNMGNLDSYFKEIGDHVQITSLKRTTNVESSSICYQAFHTLRGRLFYSIDYNTAHMSFDTARKLIDTIFQIFNDVILT